jgi:hypothetical protein
MNCPNFALATAMKIFQSTSTSHDIQDRARSNDMDCKVELAKFALEVLKKRSGLHLFMDTQHSSSLSLPSTTPDSSLANTIRLLPKSAFLQKVAHEVVAIISELITPQPLLITTYQSMLVTYAEILCHMICSTCEQVSLEDRRLYFGLDSLLRVQTIILPPSQDSFSPLRDLQKLLYQINTYLS